MVFAFGSSNFFARTDPKVMSSGEKDSRKSLYPRHKNTLPDSAMNIIHLQREAVRTEHYRSLDLVIDSCIQDPLIAPSFPPEVYDFGWILAKKLLEPNAKTIDLSIE